MRIIDTSKSTCLASAKATMDSETETYSISVVFRNRTFMEYSYLGLSLEQVDALGLAGSQGRFFNRVISKFPYTVTHLRANA